MSDKVLEEKEEKEKEIKQPENFVVYDSKTLLFSRQHLCIYLRELYDLADKEMEEAKQRGDKAENRSEDEA
ncbi:MAG: hypothetical protein N2596_09395 [Syntrophorhabdaceae bacterium]|nr:hypothetical protein [Syntrophorhabdaceae bacterium]